MSTERIIQVADLSLILGSLRSLQSDIGTVSGQVDMVGSNLAQTRAELSRLEQAFNDFVQADLKAKELGFAETRQVKIRQEIESKFGQYAIVRRQATGILQAADIQLVRQETIRNATEELMLSTPRYWLAPALVALAAWLTDKRQLAERALAEATRRDDEKTSLFFSLIGRRAGRAEVSRIWLDRYFGLQNPYSLDRQTVVMIDALANGVFNTDTALLCTKRISGWIEELSQQAGFAQTQRGQWGDALRSKTPHFNHAQRYTHLSRFSPMWNDLNGALNAASMQSIVLEHFQDIFQGEIKVASSVLIAVDNLLTSLVSHFDDEELPLRRTEQLNQLIIEEAGDKRAAQQRFDLQSKAQEERVDFTQLLTNAAMHPELSHVTRATQRLAVAHSRDWIVDAHSDVTAQIRQQVPQTIHLEIEDWKGQTAQGDNEAELQDSLRQHIEQRKQQALEQAKLGLKDWGLIALGVVLLLMSFANGIIVFVMGLAALGWAFIGYRQVQQRRKQIERDFAVLQEQSTQALRACLAETVEWRRDWAMRDAVAAEVSSLLESISPEQHLLAGHNTTRRVMPATAAQAA